MSDEIRAADDTRALVRDHYGAVARGATGVGPRPATGCCPVQTVAHAQTLGYQPDDATAAPTDANLGLGCGNPTALASLRPGETVLDLGAGGGFDCFLAARQVGPAGHVIGVDMTPDMVTLARANARKAAATNVDFRLGEIEHLPVADASVDVILSNCVVNLAPDKAAVYREAFRVLRADGRLAVSDVVTVAPIPPALRAQAAALTGCVAGAASIDEHRVALAAAGFVDVEIAIAAGSAVIVNSWLPGADRFVATATIAARRPGPSGAVAQPPVAAASTTSTSTPGPATGCCAPSCCS